MYSILLGFKWKHVTEVEYSLIHNTTATQQR